MNANHDHGIHPDFELNQAARTITQPFPYMNVIWAFDPFADLGGAQDPAAQAVHALVASTPAVIEPVYVLRGSELGMRGGAFLEMEEKMREAAEESFSNFFRDVSLPNVTSPRFLTAKGSSLRQAVDTLLAHAQQSNCDLIVLSTHARQGVSRLLLGSFAETLMLQSTIPALVVSPKAHTMTQVSHILFPTDFSKASREAWDSALGLARQLGAKLVLFHHVDPPYAQYVEYGFPAPGFALAPEFKDYFLEVEADLRRLGRVWLDVAKRQGIHGKFILSKGAGGPVKNIVHLAKKFSGAIVALASQRGPVSSAVLGSVTRQVVRSADCPVLVMHPVKPHEENRISA